jgi:hypothetical protein
LFPWLAECVTGIFTTTSTKKYGGEKCDWFCLHWLFDKISDEWKVMIPIVQWAMRLVGSNWCMEPWF